MALQNFVDRVGPVLSADWLNQVDVDLNARLTSKQVGMSSSKSASYNRGALQEAVDSGLGRLDIITDYAGETFLIDGAIDVPNGMEIQGINRWGCNISSTDLDAPIFRFGNTNTKNALRGLHLSYSGTPLAGANAIESNGSLDLDLYRMTISSCWNGLYLNGGGYHEIVGLRVFSYEQCGLLVDGAIDVNLSVFRMSAYARPGSLGGIRLVGGVEAFTASQGDITLGTYGMTADTNGAGTRGNSPFYNRFSKVFFDSPLYNPAYLRYAQHIDFESCWFASAGHDASDTGYTALTDHAGIDMENCQHIRFIGGDTYGNGGNGVNHYGANKHITYHGMGFKRNGRWRSAERAGINVLAGATDFSVQGCTFERDADTTEFRQSIAVNVTVGASNKYSITGNALGGCSIVDGGTGTDRNVSGNTGNGSVQDTFYLTEARFGYVAGTGVNNTAAVQALITAAEAVRGTAVLPCSPDGGYIEHTGLTISGQVTIQGQGKFRTRLRLLGSATGAHGITFAANVDVADVHILDVGLDGRYAGGLLAGHAIYLPDEVTLSYGRGIKLTRVYITQWYGKGLYVGANRNTGKTYDLEISRCEDGVYIDNSSDWKNFEGEFGVMRQFCVNIPGSGADNKFTDCSMWESAEAAVNLGTTGSSPNTFTGCTFDHHTKNAVRVSGNAGSGQPHAFLGCWFRENSEAGDGLHSQIKLTDTSGVVFIGNRFTDQEGNPRPSYVVEFAGTCGEMTWVGNYVEADAYATALTNDASKLTLTTIGTTYLGGPSGTQSLYVPAGVAAGNYLSAVGVAAGNGPILTAEGADTNAVLKLSSKGTSAVEIYTQGANNRVARFMNTASQVNRLDFYGSATGNAVRIAAAGSDTDVDIELVPQGSGYAKFGTRTVLGAETVTGYITIKDSGGTLRKLAVVS